MKVKLDQTNYSTKTDTRRAKVSTHLIQQQYQILLVENLIGVDKLKTVPVDLTELNNVVDNGITKSNTIDTSGFALKAQYNTDKSGLGNKIDDNDKKIHYASVLRKFSGEVFNVKIKKKG